MTSFSNTLARILLLAAKLREESYDHAASKEASDCDDSARALHEKEQAEHGPFDGNNFYYSTVDYSTFYGKTLQEACDEAAAKEGEAAAGELIYYMLQYTWNDSTAWAEQILEIRRPEVNTEVDTEVDSLI